MADDEDGSPPARPGGSYHAQQRAKLLELAGQVHTLSEQVQALAGRVGTDDQPAVAAEVAALREDIDKIRRANAMAPPPFHWDDLEAEQRAEREAELARWVDEVLVAWYPRIAATIKTCWWEHLEARAAVTDCWLAWCGAHRASTRKHTDPAEWMAKTVPAMRRVWLEVFGDDSTLCEQHGPTRPITETAV